MRNKMLIDKDAGEKFIFSNIFIRLTWSGAFSIAPEIRKIVKG